MIIFGITIPHPEAEGTCSPHPIPISSFLFRTRFNLRNHRLVIQISRALDAAPVRFGFVPKLSDHAHPERSVCPSCQLCPPCQVKSFFGAIFLRKREVFYATIFRQRFAPLFAALLRRPMGHLEPGMSFSPGNTRKNACLNPLSQYFRGDGSGFFIRELREIRG